MLKDTTVPYWDKWEGGSRTATPHMAVAANADPTIISLTKVEFRRLLDIETAAQTALQAMSVASIHEKDLTDAAVALDVALHMPVFGG